MTELSMDVLPVKGGPIGTYRVILVVGGGAAPTIEGITAESFLQRLQDVLRWPKATIDRLHDQLMRHGRLSNERLDSPTREQLQQLGFNLEGWRGQI